MNIEKRKLFQMTWATDDEGLLQVLELTTGQIEFTFYGKDNRVAHRVMFSAEQARAVGLVLAQAAEHVDDRQAVRA